MEVKMRQDGKPDSDFGKIRPEAVASRRRRDGWLGIRLGCRLFPAARPGLQRVKRSAPL
jgi:hypothetical protein